MSRSQRKPNDLLRHRRDLRGWSQRRVAEEIGTSEDVVSRWERGERVPDPYFREKLCDLFGKNAEELGLIPSTQYDSLSSYLRRQREHVLMAIAPGSATLRVREIIDENDLLISPPWKLLQESQPSTALVNYLIENVLNGQRLLLLGDAGQGKTTILKYVFARLVDLFLEKFNPSRMALPLFIPLREFSSFSGNPIDLLWTHVGDDFPLSYDEFTALVHDKQIIFMFDAFDEVKGEVTQRLINERATSKIFSYSSILTCRKSFFETYLAMTPLQDHYQQCIELQPLSLNQDVIHYVSCFCQQKQKGGSKARFSSPAKVIGAIQMSQELQDLAQRPLLLLMILEVFTSFKQDWHKEKWSVTTLYRRYTEQWLKNEASKPDSVLKWNEKASLLQEIAWFTYRGKSTQPFSQYANQQTAFTHEELSRFVHSVANRYHTVTEVQLLDDLCFRAFGYINFVEIHTVIKIFMRDFC